MKINLKTIENSIKARFKKDPVRSTVASALSQTDILRIVERRDREYVLYGDDNIAPNRLKELLHGSPIHASIIKTKALMTAGDGLLINGAKNQEESEAAYNSLVPKEKADFDWIMKNPYGQEGFNTFLNKVSNDYVIYGAFCYQVVWNQDFTKISSYMHIPIGEIRSGKMENGKVEEYYRAYDWACKRPDYNEYYPFDQKDQEHINQLVYFKKGNLNYYGEPDYIGSIMWIQIDYNMGLFHLSNIENGMNPGLHWKFYTVPGSDNEKQEIIDDIKASYRGPKNTGNNIVTFSGSKETQTEITPIESSTLDKQLVHLSELCDSKILSGHQLTSPLLAGISVSGQIGGNTELETAYKLYDNMIMEKSRNDVIGNLNKYIFNINVPNIKVDILPFSPLKNKLEVKQNKGIIDAVNSLSPLVANKVLESMTSEEIRGLIGLKGPGNTGGTNA